MLFLSINKIIVSTFKTIFIILVNNDCILFVLIVDQMAVPCCFCVKEFPTWSSVVTSHIASHVKIKSIRCVECCLGFASKETLMSHLHSCHSLLPKGICIDVSIENHERRRYLKNKSDLQPDTETLLSSKVLCMDKQQDSAETMQDIGVVNKKDDQIIMTTYKQGVCGADRVKTESGRCGTVSDVDDVEPNASSSISSKENATTPASQTDNIVKDTTNFSVTKTCRRKSRKPSHVISNNEGSEVVCASDCNWVEIVAATQPMIAQCSSCTFTCNTELQLKV